MLDCLGHTRTPAKAHSPFLLISCISTPFSRFSLFFFTTPSSFSSRGRQKMLVVLRRWCCLFISGIGSFPLFFGLLVSHYLLHYNMHIKPFHVLYPCYPSCRTLPRSILTAFCQHAYIYDCCDTWFHHVAMLSAVLSEVIINQCSLVPCGKSIKKQQVDGQVTRVMIQIVRKIFSHDAWRIQ